MRIARLIVLFTAAALSGVFSVFAAGLLSTADEAGLEHFSVSGFYERSRVEPTLRLTGSNAIQVPTTSGNATVFSNSKTDLSLAQEAEFVGASFVFRPHGLRYTVSVSQVRRFEVEFASGSDTNRLQSFDSGYAVSLGVAGSFVPQSIASVGLGWDFRYRMTKVDFDRFRSAAGQVPSNQKLMQDEFQAGVVASRRWGQVAPYGGLKLQRWVTRLEDRLTRERVRGVADGVSPFVGIEWTPMPGEVAMVEASFVDEEAISAQWAIRF